MQLAILGRQAKLGLAELESLVGAEHVQPVGRDAAQVTGTLKGNQLGSVRRLADQVGELTTHTWHEIITHAANYLAEQCSTYPEGKLTIGVSVFGFTVSPRQLLAAGLDIKRACRTNGRSVRLVPNTGAELNSAQVIHNKLTHELGYELLIIKNGATTLLGRTTWVQDIDAYTARDYDRPKRDAFVGMLPPKLAQTMLNLAQVQPGNRVLDPFCGTGVVLQEAALMGAHAYGTDISEKMVDYSRHNSQWLAQKYQVAPNTIRIEQGDATTYTWEPPLDHVVCETYLGQPLSGLPKPQKLAEIMRDCNTIIGKFLKNLAPQLKNGTRLVVAVPAWRVGHEFRHLELLDHLEDLGYNRVRFQHARNADLVYHREDQIVARELLVLLRK